MDRYRDRLLLPSGAYGYKLPGKSPRATQPSTNSNKLAFKFEPFWPVHLTVLARLGVSILPDTTCFDHTVFSRLNYSQGLLLLRFQKADGLGRAKGRRLVSSNKYQWISVICGLSLVPDIVRRISCESIAFGCFQTDVTIYFIFTSVAVGEV